MKFSKVAILLATVGLSLTLVGVGLSAAFTDSGTAKYDTAVGNFDFYLFDWDTGDGYGCNPNGTKNIVCTLPVITTSSGTQKIEFGLHPVGTIPMNATVTVTTPPPAGFSVTGLSPVSPFAVSPGTDQKISAYLNWSGLINADFGKLVSLTFTVNLADPSVSSSFTRILSSSLGFAGTGWAGWSCPAGTTAIGGGLVTPHATTFQGLAGPNSIWPHYTYGPTETGYVVQYAGSGGTNQIYVDCQ